MARAPRRRMYLAPSGVTIRAPGPADAEALGRMHWAAWREAYSDLLPRDFWSAEGEQRRIDSWVRHLSSAVPSARIRVAERDGVIVGFAGSGPAQPNESAGATARDRELWSMYVLASEYGSGLGHALLDAALPEDEPAQLWVFELNPRARAFYEKHGFRADGARHVFGPTLGNQPEIRMVR